MGVFAAIVVFAMWGGHLAYCLLSVDFRFDSPLSYLHLLLQAYLSTGLFITAHDAMHGAVSRNHRLNRAIGTMAALLFAAFSYKKLHRNHMNHHRYSGQERDPDFLTTSQNFFLWFGVFFYRYASIGQIMIMAILFNLLNLVLPTERVVAFWMIPPFISTLQLFFFGTYRPHRLPHTEEMGPHHARSQKLNPLFALLSCYNFGYHLEHHEAPGVPWWRLGRVKAGLRQASR